VNIHYFNSPLFCIVLSALVVVGLRTETLSYTTSVSVETSTKTFASEQNSTATGYIWFQQGFVIAASRSLTLDIEPQINGAIDFNGTGTLILSRDITLGSNASFSNSGTIQGGGFSIHLTHDLTYGGTNKTLTFSGTNTTIDGNNHVLTITDSSQFSVASGKTLTLKNMTLVLSSTADVLDIAGTIVLDNVRVVFGSTHYTCNTGSMTIKNNCIFIGASGYVWTFSSSGDFTILSNSQLHLDHDITFKHDSSATTNFVFTDRTSRLLMTGSTLEKTTSTLTLIKGTLIFDHKSYLKGSSSGDITLGSTANAGADRLYIIFLPAATIDASGRTVTYANAS
jgi:hypothetical protein